MGQPAAAVDAVVTRRGEPVRDLRPEDVRLWVAGKPVPATAVRASSTETARVALVFDNGTLSAAEQVRIRRQVIAFLQSGAHQRRLFAVIKWVTGMDVVQPFTADRALIASTIENLGASAITATGTSGEITSGYAAEAGRTTGGALTSNSMNATGLVVRTQYLMASVSALCEKLAPMQGMKAVWFITGGGYLTSSEDFVRRIYDKTNMACNRARVAVHIISNDVAFSDTASSGTGGRAMRLTGTLDQALERLATEDANSLQIEFAAPALASGCHDVRVKVPKEMDARWRKKYCAP